MTHNITYVYDMFPVCFKLNCFVVFFFYIINIDLCPLAFAL